jgi:hypothetical protein
MLIKLQHYTKFKEILMVNHKNDNSGAHECRQNLAKWEVSIFVCICLQFNETCEETRH